MGIIRILFLADTHLCQEVVKISNFPVIQHEPPIQKINGSMI